MSRMQTFQEFLATQTTHIPVLGFVFNLVIAAILSSVLGYIYVRYGKSLSNRRIFANNFMLITMTTTVIIAIVKSSLALSLGLVGALSIVRFRAAIKEPEELAYLFLAIAVGLGLGADQRLITFISFVVIGSLIFLKGRLTQSDDHHNLCLTVFTDEPDKAALDDIVAVLQRFCSDVQLRRFDETDKALEASFRIAYDDFEKLKRSREELRKLHRSLKITFLDNKGIG